MCVFVFVFVFFVFVLLVLVDDFDLIVFVQKIMQISQSNLSGDDFSQDDYFFEKWMLKLFSFVFVMIVKKGFVKVEVNNEFFIDYDLVLGGQDGCVLKDFMIINVGLKDGGYDIVVKFYVFYCFDNVDNCFSEMYFKVVMENGVVKIDDIVNIVLDGDLVLLCDIMNGYFFVQ